jgi:helicase
LVELRNARRAGPPALFSDTLGGTAQLLNDEQATRAAIQQEFEVLASCDPDNVVVIAFSGHGSETHELATYDTRLDDLAATTIPLSVLAEWFTRIGHVVSAALVNDDRIEKATG